MTGYKRKTQVVSWCEECEKRFTSSQPLAKYCSGRCKKKAWRRDALASGRIKLKGGKRGRPSAKSI